MAVSLRESTFVQAPRSVRPAELQQVSVGLLTLLLTNRQRQWRAVRLADSVDSLWFVTQPCRGLSESELLYLSILCDPTKSECFLGGSIERDTACMSARLACIDSFLVSHEKPCQIDSEGADVNLARISSPEL